MAEELATPQRGRGRPRKYAPRQLITPGDFEPFETRLLRTKRNLAFKLIARLLDYEEPGDPVSVEAVRLLAGELGKIYDRAANELSAATRKETERDNPSA